MIVYQETMMNNNEVYDSKDCKKTSAQAGVSCNGHGKLTVSWDTNGNTISGQSVKCFFAFLLVLVFSNCATIDVSTLQETEVDKDSLAQLVDFESVQLSSVGVLVSSQTKADLAGAYGESFKSATEKLANSLGGVVVVTDHKAWDKQVKEAKDEQIKQLKRQKSQQAIGEKEKQVQKFNTKFTSWYEVNAELNGGTSETKYFPPKPVKVKDSNGVEREEMSEPFWSTTVTAYIYFKVSATDPGLPKRVVLIRNINNSFSKSFKHEPTQEEVIQLFPEAILYCYEDIREELQEIFPIKSYLTTMREEKKYGRIIGGSNLGIVPDREFQILEKGTIDTAVGEREIYHTVGKMKIFEVRENESWGKISGKITGNKDDIKVGMDVVIVPERRNIFHKIWRYVKSNLGLKF
jgi:hypothetical protein